MYLKAINLIYILDKYTDLLKNYLRLYENMYLY